MTAARYLGQSEGDWRRELAFPLFDIRLPHITLDELAAT